MTTISDFPPRFFADDGEVITVNVSNQNTTFLVTQKVGTTPSAPVASGSAVRFTMSNSSQQLILVLQLGFAPADGTGVYTVDISGNAGGDSFHGTFDGKFGVELLEQPFEFRISDF